MSRILDGDVISALHSKLSAFRERRTIATRIVLTGGTLNTDWRDQTVDILLEIARLADDAERRGLIRERSK